MYPKIGTLCFQNQPTDYPPKQEKYNTSVPVILAYEYQSFDKTCIDYCIAQWDYYYENWTCEGEPLYKNLKVIAWWALPSFIPWYKDDAAAATYTTSTGG